MTKAKAKSSSFGRKDSKRSAPRLTEWFPSDAKPVRTGVYEVTAEGDTFFSAETRWFAFWDGSRFCYRWNNNPAGAYKYRKSATLLPGLTIWRGLAARSKT